MSRKTVFSRTKATVRHVIRSVIRDWAVWMIGALWPSSRPATTTEMTPEACTSSAATNAANGVRNEIAVSISGSVIRLRSHATSTKKAKPISSAAAGRADEVDADLGQRDAAGEGGDGGAQGDQGGGVVEQRLALEDRHDPAWQPDPLRATAVAATASGGATTAPIAMAAAQPMPGTSHVHDRRRPRAT